MQSLQNRNRHRFSEKPDLSNIDLKIGDRHLFLRMTFHLDYRINSENRCQSPIFKPASDHWYDRSPVDRTFERSNIRTFKQTYILPATSAVNSANRQL